MHRHSCCSEELALVIGSHLLDGPTEDANRDRSKTRQRPKQMCCALQRATWLQEMKKQWGCCIAHTMHTLIAI